MRIASLSHTSIHYESIILSGEVGVNFYFPKYLEGHRGALVTLTERKSRLARIRCVPRRQAEAVAQATLKLLSSLSQFVHTITSDNGKEFAQHQAIAEALQADFYFAHPYAS